MLPYPGSQDEGEALEHGSKASGGSASSQGTHLNVQQRHSYIFHKFTIMVYHSTKFTCLEQFCIRSH
jgi:hypothetical protein